jgi:3-deoxy-manno-octulosonate cytidylyltransferase (CMP-KDO synthetase)
MGKVIGVIPARLASSRLARKALRLIGGYPMIVWVYRRARQARSLDQLLVATDAEEVAACCQNFQIPFLMTSASHGSGTDRLVEVAGRETADIYVNVQGDEPMVGEKHIELLLEPFRQDSAAAVTTLKVAISAEEAGSPNNVKVVTDVNGHALYFSRWPVPYDRDGSGQTQRFKHLGFYAYRRAALEAFSRLRPSPLEMAERLEQLRFLENGIPITVAETRDNTIGVDTEEDLRKVEEFFRHADESLPKT